MIKHSRNYSKQPLVYLGFFIFAVIDLACFKSPPRYPTTPVSFEALWEVRANPEWKNYRLTTDGVNTKGILLRNNPNNPYQKETNVRFSDSESWWKVGLKHVGSKRPVEIRDTVAGRKTNKYKLDWETTVWLDQETGIELKRMTANAGLIHECREIRYGPVDPSVFTEPDPGFAL